MRLRRLHLSRRRRDPDADRPRGSGKLRRYSSHPSRTASLRCQLRGINRGRRPVLSVDISRALNFEGENIMTSEQKKSFVTETWAAFGKGDIKTAFANLSDNVSWLIPGTTPGVS